MNGFDFLVDQRLEVKQLHRTIFPILEIKSENLLICNGIDEVPDAHSNNNISYFISCFR
jgi:hypothetical protein